MKLYAFRPKNFGYESFFVMAQSDEAARSAINAYMVANKFSADDIRQVNGEGDEPYVVTVLGENDVITNDNA